MEAKPPTAPPSIMEELQAEEATPPEAMPAFRQSTKSPHSAVSPVKARAPSPLHMTPNSHGKKRTASEVNFHNEPSPKHVAHHKNNLGMESVEKVFEFIINIDRVNLDQKAQDDLRQALQTADINDGYVLSLMDKSDFRMDLRLSLGFATRVVDAIQERQKETTEGNWNRGTTSPGLLTTPSRGGKLIASPQANRRTPQTAPKPPRLPQSSSAPKRGRSPARHHTGSRDRDRSPDSMPRSASHEHSSLDLELSRWENPHAQLVSGNTFSPWHEIPMPGHKHHL